MGVCDDNNNNKKKKKKKKKKGARIDTYKALLVVHLHCHVVQARMAVQVHIYSVVPRRAGHTRGFSARGRKHKF